MEITAKNVNHMLEEALWRFKVGGVPTDTRNGRALVIPEPVILKYQRPWRRVLFSPARDANPIFHVMESIWIFAGREDVSFLEQFNSKIAQYSDDGKVFNAAYGQRIRKNFGFDQLYSVIDELRRTPGSRQAVVQIWDTQDLGASTKDKACNMSIIFSIVDSKLNMTVMNRSNDLWWGACGANAVHFSFIQEFVAAALNIEMGVYYQVTNNLHLYLDLYNTEEYLVAPVLISSNTMYAYNQMDHFPLLSGTDFHTFLGECAEFCRNPFLAHKYKSDFLREVAFPMAMVSKSRKEGEDGLRHANAIKAEDWRIATTDWVKRREEARNASI